MFRPNVQSNRDFLGTCIQQMTINDVLVKTGKVKSRRAVKQKHYQKKKQKEKKWPHWLVSSRATVQSFSNPPCRFCMPVWTIVPISWSMLFEHKYWRYAVASSPSDCQSHNRKKFKLIWTRMRWSILIVKITSSITTITIW